MDWLTIILGAILLALLAGYMYLSRSRGYLESTGIPLVKPFLCFGSPPFILHNITYHEDYMNNFKKFGKTWCKYEGITPLIVTYDSELVKEIAVKQFDCFTDTFPNDFADDQITLDLAK